MAGAPPIQQTHQQGAPASWGPAGSLGLKAFDAQSRLTSGLSDAATAATVGTRAAAPIPAAGAASAGASWLRMCPVCCCSLSACTCDAAAIAAEHQRQLQQQEIVYQRRLQLQQQREQLERVNALQQKQKTLLQQQLNSSADNTPLHYSGASLRSCSNQSMGADAVPLGIKMNSGVSRNGGVVPSWQQQPYLQQQQQKQGPIAGLVLSECSPSRGSAAAAAEVAEVAGVGMHCSRRDNSQQAQETYAAAGVAAAAAAVPAVDPSCSLQGAVEAPCNSGRNTSTRQKLSDAEVALEMLGIAGRRKGDRRRQGERRLQVYTQPSREAQSPLRNSSCAKGSQEGLAAANVNNEYPHSGVAAATAAPDVERQFRTSTISPQIQPHSAAAEGLCCLPASKTSAEESGEDIWQETPEGRRALQAYLFELQARLAEAEKQATHNFVGCLYREMHLQELGKKFLTQSNTPAPIADIVPLGPLSEMGTCTRPLACLLQAFVCVDVVLQHLQEALKRKHVAEMKLRAHIASLAAVNEQLQAEASTLMNFHRLAEAHGPEAAEKLLLQQLRSQTEKQSTEIKDLRRKLVNREDQVSALECEVAMCRKALGVLHTFLQCQGQIQQCPPEPRCLPPPVEDRTTQTDANSTLMKPLSTEKRQDSASTQVTPQSPASQRSIEGLAEPSEEETPASPKDCLQDSTPSSESVEQAVETEETAKDAEISLPVSRSALKAEAPRQRSAEYASAGKGAALAGDASAPLRGIGPVMRFTVGPATGYEHRRDDAVDSAVAALSNARINKVLFTRICSGVYLYGHLAVAMRLSPSGELWVSFDGREYTAMDFIRSFEEEEFRYLKKKQKESGRAVSLEVCPHNSLSQKELRTQEALVAAFQRCESLQGRCSRDSSCGSESKSSSSDCDKIVCGSGVFSVSCCSRLWSPSERRAKTADASSQRSAFAFCKQQEGPAE
ncbi:hypothetical protein, conserved [Eimeria maxima]|uniref:Uncharacterized protein n=1 Tax=Eimeria maxima TaxID=5804 RepID=U6MAQ6_EIMMA|nr:hypothetical protein, conserved [Eimeria maxima]CDJ60133.1 hypothetical protein, conserved [Eimeria maxima]